MAHRLNVGSVEVKIRPKYKKLAKLRCYIGINLIKAGEFVINGRT